MVNSLLQLGGGGGGGGGGKQLETPDRPPDRLSSSPVLPTSTPVTLLEGLAAKPPRDAQELPSLERMRSAISGSGVSLQRSKRLRAPDVYSSDEESSASLVPSESESASSSESESEGEAWTGKAKRTKAATRRSRRMTVHEDADVAMSDASVSEEEPARRGRTRAATKKQKQQKQKQKKKPKKRKAKAKKAKPKKAKPRKRRKPNPKPVPEVTADLEFDPALLDRLKQASVDSGEEAPVRRKRQAPKRRSQPQPAARAPPVPVPKLSEEQLLHELASRPDEASRRACLRAQGFVTRVTQDAVLAKLEPARDDAPRTLGQRVQAGISTVAKAKAAMKRSLARSVSHAKAAAAGTLRRTPSLYASSKPSDQLLASVGLAAPPRAYQSLGLLRPTANNGMLFEFEAPKERSPSAPSTPEDVLPAGAARSLSILGKSPLVRIRDGVVVSPHSSSPTSAGSPVSEHLGLPLIAARSTSNLSLASNFSEDSASPESAPSESRPTLQVPKLSDNPSLSLLSLYDAPPPPSAAATAAAAAASASASGIKPAAQQAFGRQRRRADRMRHMFRGSKVTLRVVPQHEARQPPEGVSTLLTYTFTSLAAKFPPASHFES